MLPDATRLTRSQVFKAAQLVLSSVLIKRHNLAALDIDQMICASFKLESLVLSYDTVKKRLKAEPFTSYLLVAGISIKFVFSV